MLAIYGGRKVIEDGWDYRKNITKEMEKCLLDVLYSGEWGYNNGQKKNMKGKYLTLFETQVQKMLGTPYAIAMSSCTAALDVAIRSIGIGSGDEVIVTSYSYIASATCILNSGGTPVFADVDKTTWNIKLDEIEKKISKRTKALLIVHFAGQVVDMEKICKFAKKHELYVIEDVAHAFGAKFQGKYLGTWGDIGCFSFQDTKNISSGEGGMLLSSNSQLYKKASYYYMAGRNIEKGKWYEHYYLGWNYRMTEFQAALLYCQLENYMENETKRKRNAKILKDFLSNIEGIQVVDKEIPCGERVYHLFTMLYFPEQWEGLSKKRFILALQAEGVPCMEGYKYPIYKNPLFDHIEYDNVQNTFCPVAEFICESSIWLPHWVLLWKPDKLEKIYNAFLRIQKNIKQLVR